MQPQIVDESQMHPELDAEIRQALCLCFPDDAAVFSQTRQWHGSGPAYSAILCHDGRVIAHVGIVDRTVAFGEGSSAIRARTAGVQNVFVRPEYRGQGLSDAVMRAAQAEAVQHGFDCGLLFCIPKLESVYARTGWQTISNEVLRIDEDGVEKPLPGKNVAMFLPIRLVSPPPSVIHLLGNDW